MTEQQPRIIFILHADQLKQVDRIADTLRVSRSAVIRFAIDAYIRDFFTPSVAIDSHEGDEKPAELSAA